MHLGNTDPMLQKVSFHLWTYPSLQAGNAQRYKMSSPFPVNPHKSQPLWTCKTRSDITQLIFTTLYSSCLTFAKKTSQPFPQQRKLPRLVKQ